MEETLTGHRLGVPDQLRRTLACTNVIESAFSIVETVCRNVKRWRDGDQIERWVGSGLLVAEREALVWRGPMIHSAVQQFLRDVMWGALDYLVFDMPPGTGDAQLSLSQIVPLTGVVMVTTPQDVALLDVRKALGMFRKLNVPILGIVENMSHFVAPDTGVRYAIFGEGGGARVADEFDVPLLGQIPLEMETRRGGDAGVPIVVGQPDSAQARAFREVAAAVSARVEAVSALKLPTIG